MTSELNRLGVWAVGYAVYPFAIDVIFEEEIDALRYALGIGGKAVFVPFGLDVADAVRAAG